MPYLTLTEKSKATTEPWLSRLLLHPARKWSGSILGHTHMLTYLLTTNPHRTLAIQLPAMKVFVKFY